MARDTSECTWNLEFISSKLTASGLAIRFEKWPKSVTKWVSMESYLHGRDLSPQLQKKKQRKMVLVFVPRQVNVLRAIDAQSCSLQTDVIPD